MPPRTSGAFTTSCCARSRLLLPSRTRRNSFEFDGFNELFVVAEGLPVAFGKAVFFSYCAFVQQTFGESRAINDQLADQIAIEENRKAHDVVHAKKCPFARE